MALKPAQIAVLEQLGGHVPDKLAAPESTPQKAGPWG